jgi:allantoinase
MDLVVRSSRVVLPEGVVPAAIFVSGGTIAMIARSNAPVLADLEIEAGDAVAMAGLVDPHVHVNDPGRADWEGFETAGLAAAAGGTTTIVDMPLNSLPVTTTVDALRAKVRAATGTCRVDFGHWGGIVPGNGDDRRALVDEGALGLKAFLVPSGIDEFPEVDDLELGRAMEALASIGAPVLVHAEDAGELARVAGDAGTPLAYADWLASRPPEAEARAVARVAALCRRTAGRAHIVHVAAAEAVDEVAAAKAAGLPLSAETCPHYLSFAAEEIPARDPRFKCAPPIREARHRDALWRGLVAGVLDLVASDHSPCPTALKPPGELARAWGGIAGLELRLPVTWTEARARGASLGDLARWLAEAPARIAGLSDRKGRIAVGHDADFVIWDPERESVVESGGLHQRHPQTPWEGRTLRGVVQTTILRGRVVHERGRFPGPPRGRWLRRAARAAEPLAAAGSR